MAAPKTPAVITEADKLLDLAKKARPAGTPGKPAPPQTPPGKPSPKG